MKFTETALKKLKPKAARYEVAKANGRGFRLRVYPSGRKTFIARYRFSAHSRVAVYGPFPAKTLAKTRVIAASMVASGESPVRVVGLPWLDGGNYFYMLPDPDQAPAIATGGLDDSGPLTISRVDSAILPSDLIGWRLRLEFALSPVSRSIVRGTLS